MGKAGNCTGWDNTDRSQWVAFKSATLVIDYTDIGYKIGAGTAYRTRRGCAPVPYSFATLTLPHRFLLC